MRTGEGDLAIEQDERLRQAVNGNLIVEQSGEFVIRYGYNSSMDLTEVIAVLEHMGIPAENVTSVMSRMAKAGVPLSKLVNYLASYYRIFGW